MPFKLIRIVQNNYKYYESRETKDKKLSVKQYLYKIVPYLSDLINNNKAKSESKEWKIQITMQANFISSKDAGEICTIYDFNFYYKLNIAVEKYK